MGGSFPEGTKQCWGEDDSTQTSTANSSDSLTWTLHICTNHMYSTKYVKNRIYYNRRTKSIRNLRENPDPTQMALCFRLRPGYSDIRVGPGFTLYHGSPSIWGKQITPSIILSSLSRTNLWPHFEVHMPPNKSYMKFHGWCYTTYYYCKMLLIYITFKYRWKSLCNTAEKTFHNNILPSYLPMLCQQSTIRPKDSTCIIELSTILFWNGSFVKVRTEISRSVLLM